MNRGKRRRVAHDNHERWLVSYADFITLMFAFFVVMFASAQADKGRVKQISESVTKALENGATTGVRAAVAQILGGTADDKGKGNSMMKGPGGAHLDSNQPAAEKPPQSSELLPSLHYLNSQLKREVDAGEMQISLQSRGLVVSLRQGAFFPSGEDTIDPATYPSLAKVADAIGKLPNPVRLEGHTDSNPIHTARFRSNWELSAARAIAVLDLLTDRFQVPRERLAIGGYAETAPVASNDTEEGRARNRRVDIVILNRGQILNEPEAAPQGSQGLAAGPRAGALDTVSRGELQQAVAPPAGGPSATAAPTAGRTAGSQPAATAKEGTHGAATATGTGAPPQGTSAHARM